jgi:hypothetical protein
MTKRIKTVFMFFLSAVFIFTTVSIAYHHHDLPYRFSTCSICKIKNSLSTPVKSNISTSVQMAFHSSISTVYYSDSVGMIIDAGAVKQIAFTFQPFSNRSPPFQS